LTKSSQYSPFVIRDFYDACATIIMNHRADPHSPNLKEAAKIARSAKGVRDPAEIALLAKYMLKNMSNMSGHTAESLRTVLEFFATAPTERGKNVSTSASRVSDSKRE